MSLLAFKGTSRVRSSLIWFLNFSQFVFFILRVGVLVLGMILEFRVTITGERFEDRSKLDSACRLFIGIHFTTPKLIRSGTFCPSLGQQVGSPVEICDKLSVCMALNNSCPLRVICHEPQWQCFAL